MLNLVILLLLELVLFVYALHKFKKDFFSPFVFTILTMMLSTILCIGSQSKWQMELNYETLFVIFIGLLFMLLGSSLPFVSRNKRKVLFEEANVYRVSLWNQLLLSFVSVVCTYMYINEMLELIVLANLEEGSGVGEIKDLMASGDYAINPIIKQFYKIVLSLSYICFLFLSNNLVCKRTFSSCFLYLIPVSCGCIISIGAGNRIEIFKFLVSCFLIFIIVWRRHNKWKNFPSKYIIKYGIPAFAVFISLFIALRTITKSSGEAQEAGEDTFNYVSYYIGSPIQVFNIYINQGVENWESPHFMGNTFDGVYRFLDDHGILKRKEARRSSFVYIGGKSNIHGNVATFFSSPYLDAGFLGVAFVCFFTYYLFSLYYYHRIVFSKDNLRSDLRLLLFSFCFSNIIALAFYGTNLKAIISQTGVLTLLTIMILYFVITNKLVNKVKHV